MSALMTQLASIVGDSHVLSGEAIADRATSYWNASPIQTIAIVKPASTEEVSQVLSFCHQQGQSVVIQSGGTGVCEGADPSLKDVVISLERMNRIIHVDQNEMVATVEAGVILHNLQETLADEGLLFPLDLGARGSCMIGGNVATNAGGINVLRYGMVRNLVQRNSHASRITRAINRIRQDFAQSITVGELARTPSSTRVGNLRPHSPTGTLSAKPLETAAGT